MKTLFVSAVLGGDFSAMDIAVTGLATWVNERTPHRAGILDLAFRRSEWRKILADGIERHRPDLVALSCNTMYMRYVRMVGGEVKRLRPDLPIILGGHHASIHREETFALPFCDYLCVGDGEEPLSLLLDALEKQGGFEGIPGLWWKRNGEAVRNPGGGFRQDLDSLPIPDWDLWETLDEYFYHLGMLYIIGSRGCPYRCTYCDAHAIGSAMGGVYYRERDPVLYARDIAEMWRRFRGRNVRLAQLFDPVFTMKREWVGAFCDEYRALGLASEFRFSAFSRIDHLDEEKISAMAESGCALLRVGLEAGDQRIREQIYRKRIPDGMIREIFRLAKSKGIDFTAFYILGGPAETRETLQRTIDLAWELDAARSAFFIYKPFTKEGVQQIAEHGGWVNEKRWAKADNITFDAVVESPNLGAKVVERYQRKAYFLTFGRRLVRMILRQKLRYFVRLAIYMARGLRNGLDPRYLMVYFHIYSYDNVDR